MERGIELWILSKFAFIFFLFALLALMVTFSTREKSAICSETVQNIAERIAAKISQVVSSPVEDERGVIPLETSIQLASGRERYSINFTYINITKPERFIINVKKIPESPADPCTGGASAILPVNNTPTVNILSGRKNTTTVEGGKLNWFPVTPSDPDHRDRYLVVIRCGEKCSRTGNVSTCTAGAWPPPRYLIVDACTQENPDMCLPLNSTDVGKLCGFK